MAEKRVWIRALIGINSPTTRAIKKILMVPGLNLPKIVILCGGPDWPTSVTTGILKCSLPQMLLGTLPIMFLIVPTVMTGAFKNKEQDGPMYQTLSGIFMVAPGLENYLWIFSKADLWSAAFAAPVLAQQIIMWRVERSVAGV